MSLGFFGGLRGSRIWNLADLLIDGACGDTIALIGMEIWDMDWRRSCFLVVLGVGGWRERVDAAREGVREGAIRAPVLLERDAKWWLLFADRGVSCTDDGRDWAGVAKGEVDDRRARLRWYDDGA